MTKVLRASTIQHESTTAEPCWNNFHRNAWAPRITRPSRLRAPDFRRAPCLSAKGVGIVGLLLPVPCGVEPRWPVGHGKLQTRGEIFGSRLFVLWPSLYQHLWPDYSLIPPELLLFRPHSSLTGCQDIQDAERRVKSFQCTCMYITI